MNKTLTAVKERPLKCRKEFILTCEIDIKGNKMLYFNSPHFNCTVAVRTQECIHITKSLQSLCNYKISSNEAEKNS